MSAPRVSLKNESSVITKGTTPTSLGHAFTDSGVPFIRAQNLVDGSVSVSADPLFISPATNDALKRSKIKADDVLISIAGTIGRAAIVPSDAQEMNCNQAVAIVRPSENIDRRFLLHWLSSNDALSQMARGKVTGVISNLSLGEIGKLEIPLPPLEEQKRIAGILDQADALRRLRTRALEKLGTLGQAFFHEMFGDPAANPKGWPESRIRDAVAEISDGPFGSNLKSSHYTDTGVRVWRLQNIGVGHLVDKDKAYISEEHFQTLRKHECIPDDVLVGTMGNPNLRACIQPAWLETALNKADCVKIRPDKVKALSAFWIGLLNHPSTLEIAQSAVLGQTRARISMGRLRELKVPIPPINLQEEYAQQIKNLEMQKAHQIAANALEEALFASLQQRAFRGEL